MLIALNEKHKPRTLKKKIKGLLVLKIEINWGNMVSEEHYTVSFVI